MISTNAALPGYVSFSCPSGPDKPTERPKLKSLADAFSSKRNKRKRILVVDDAPEVTEMMAMLLRYAGCEVETGVSGQDALEKAAQSNFDLIVSDIGMPGMNGYELAAAIRVLPAYSQTPLVAVTGFSMYDDRERAIEAGFNSFLTKPINPAALLALIEKAV